MESDIRAVLDARGQLVTDARTLPSGANLYQAGLTSHATVTVMLALEDRFGVEFPDAMLRKETFSSIESIGAALAQLGASACTT